MPLTRSGTDVREFLLPSIFEASTISQVREIPRPVDKAHSIVGSTGVGLVYKFDSSSSAADDGYEILRPDDTTWSGRWLLIPLGAASGGDGIYNVKSFGATGDGVTDDQASIQSAIDEATTKEGGIVFFPSGDYLIKATLVLTPGVRLMGVSGQDNTTASGIGSTISSQTVATPSVSFTGDGTTNNSSSVEVASLRIIDTGGTPTTAITFTSARNCYVNGCYFQGFSEASVNLFSGEGNIVDRVMVGSSDAIGIKFSGLSKQSQLSNSKIEGCASASGAVEIIGTADGIRVLGNQITNNFGKGIYVSTPLSTTEHIAIENNLFDGNDATDTGDQDVYFIAATSHTNASIVGNQFTSVGTSTALKLESVSDSAIDNNSFAVANASITLDASSDNNLLLGNKISGTTSDLGAGNWWDLGYDRDEVNDRALSKAPSNGLYFNGLAKVELAIGTAADFGTGDFSVAGVAYFAATPGDDSTLFDKRRGGGVTAGFMVFINSSGRLVFEFGDGTTGINGTNDGDDLTGKLFHWAVVFDRSGNATRYVNGVAYGSADAITTAALSVTNANAIRLGERASDKRFTGNIYNTIAANRALTAAEVLRLSINNVPEIADQWGGTLGGVLNETTWTPASGATPPSGWINAGSMTYTVADHDGQTAALHLEAVSGTPYMYINSLDTYQKRFRVTFKAAVISGSLSFYSNTVALGTETGATWATYTYEWIGRGGSLSFRTSSGTDDIWIDDVVITEIGSVLSLNPDNIESDGDWIDASSNELNGTNTGATPLMVKPQTSGAFTPVLQFDGVSGSTYAASGQLGYWRMIDEKTVSLEIYIQITVVGTESGAATIGGLPFISRSSEWTAQALIGGAGLQNLTGALHGLVRAYNTTIILSQTSATGDVGITDANFTPTSYLQISAVYAIA